jgi:hypothetical protein
VLWRNPADIRSRNLYYGTGGVKHAPQGTFTFDKEDLEGTSPKFDVIDQDGVKWRVKLGNEARPEVAASRLVWAAGYFANEEYFMPTLRVQNMPRLRRGKEWQSHDGTIRDVSMKRRLKDEKKIGTWAWGENPFTGSREWYGLQVLMAVINNWDVKDENNAVYQVRGDHPEQRYTVTDLGASFGRTGLTYKSKGNLGAYRHSKWIGKTSGDTVNFNVPSLPTLDIYINLLEMKQRIDLLWIGRHVPISAAKWMGNLLAQLSPNQIRDAVRAAGYTPKQVEECSEVVERRIVKLQGL